jgi:O-antigen/teichoic acid export membrane protein
MFRTEGFQKYLRNVSWLFADRVVRLASVLITSIFVTRYLGPELFGQLNYASALVGIFFALTSMGLDDILTRDLVRNPEQRDKLLGTAAVIKLGGSVLLLITVMAIALSKDIPPLTVWMVLLIAGAEIMKPMLVIEPFFHSQVRGRVVAQFNIAQTVISSIFKLALVFLKVSLIWFAAAYIVELAALAIGAYIAYHHNGLHVRNWRFDRVLAGKLLQQSWPLLVFGLALYVQAKIDQVMIGDLLRKQVSQAFADAEVGQYSVALKMIESLGFVPSIVVATLAPAITRAREQSRELYVDRIVNQYRLMFLLFLVTAIPLFFLAEPMMVLLFGEQYRAAGWLLSLFAIRLFFTNMGVAKMSFITNEGLFRISLVMSVVGAVCNIGLNYLLIPPFKSVGAIWAMIISFFVSNFLLDLFFKESRPNFGWMMKGIATFWRFHRAS